MFIFFLVFVHFLKYTFAEVKAYPHPLFFNPNIYPILYFIDINQSNKNLQILERIFLFINNIIFVLKQPVWVFEKGKCFWHFFLPSTKCFKDHGSWPLFFFLTTPSCPPPPSLYNLSQIFCSSFRHTHTYSVLT